jgi:CRISPR-associated endonuclease Csn1
MSKMNYRLALDLGSTSLGWAMVRLDAKNRPCAIIKAGVRIFSDGRNPKEGTSLAVTRREARAMRRRRDRLLKRKARMMKTLIAHGFFSQDKEDRKLLERSDPFALRAKGLDQALRPDEFARALFHINQRRGFKSNRKTDKKENDSGALKSAISQLRQAMQAAQCRTVGEWLNTRHQSGLSVRARYRQHIVQREDGKTKTEMRYDLYIDRAMIEGEFDALWQKQSELNPKLFHETARAELKDCLLHQRPLKPVKPGRCTLMPEEERAPLALPSQQRFRIYQEVNHLRLLKEGLQEQALTLEQRNQTIQALEGNTKRTFTQIKKLIGFSGEFNLEDEKRTELKGNSTSAMLSKKDLFGPAWFDLSEEQQDSIVMQLVKEENEATLVRWLQDNTGLDEVTAERVANTNLAEGYGSLCAKALQKILPVLKAEAITYDKAVLAAGFDHHSNISHASTGEILPCLPYYGEYLQRHVGFGTGKPEDTPEKRYGKIANPTVHIGLNQIRTVVNALIKRYGHPSEVIIELARDLKQSQEQRKEQQQRQAANQKRNHRMREDIAALIHISADRVKTVDLQKMILWEELSFNVANRRCPYSGAQISAQMLFSDQVEIEHILPFSETLDDSLSNKTVAMRQANRIKGDRTPWQAKDDFAKQGWTTENMLARAELMPENKRYRFSETGYTQWLRDDKGFLARALNDTRHLSRVAKEYMSLICPQDTRAVPGQLTAMLRGKFGLNNILGLDGEKNRNDHRHHAVDACVIAVTDQGMLQRFAQASASARQRQLGKLVDNMPMAWPTYREHVQRAIENIWVSHKPDHGHEGAMHEDAAWGLLPNGQATRRIKNEDGVRDREVKNKNLIQINSSNDKRRHGLTPEGDVKEYKGYVGGSNFCIEITRDEKNKWVGQVISTFEAYKVIQQHGAELGLKKLRSRTESISGKPLVMRLQKGDAVRLTDSDKTHLMRVVKMSANGQVFFAPHNEANTAERNADKESSFAYVSKMAGSLQKSNGRCVTVSPIGELKDPGILG